MCLGETIMKPGEYIYNKPFVLKYVYKASRTNWIFAINHGQSVFYLHSLCLERIMSYSILYSLVFVLPYSIFPILAIQYFNCLFVHNLKQPRIRLPAKLNSTMSRNLPTLVSIEDIFANLYDGRIGHDCKERYFIETDTLGITTVLDLEKPSAVRISYFKYG